MLIFVRAQKTMTLEISGDESVRVVKERIREKCGIQPHAQRLLFGGSILEDRRHIGDYAVRNESTLHLVQNSP